MRNKTLELITGVALAAATGVAFAQMTPTTPADTPAAAPSGGEFTKLDSDKDGMVSKKEASRNKGLTAKWDTLDTNKDGKLDQGEFAAFESTGSSPAPKY